MNQSGKISAVAPASVANVGPGFDVLGFALHEPLVKVAVRYGDARGNGILIECNNPAIPTDPTQNTASAAAAALLIHAGVTEDLIMTIESDLPIGSGLGSSAASAVAAVLATNELVKSNYSKEKLLPFALAGEAVASGARHADNVAPSLFGGFVLVRSNDPIDWVNIPVPDQLHYAVVHPEYVVKTSDARRALPRNVKLTDAVQAWAQVGALITALHQNDLELLGRAMHDSLIEPYRGELIPGYEQVKLAAAQAGAIGCTIAGSGPSMLAFARSKVDAESIATSMVKAFHDSGLLSQQWIGKVSGEGARIISQ